MTKIPVLFAEGVGRIEFDGGCAVATALDAGYPQIRPTVAPSAAPMCSNTQSVGVGAGTLTLEGCFLDPSLIRKGDGGNAPGIAAAAALAADAFTANAIAAHAAALAADAGALAAPAGPKSRAAELKALLCAIAAPGREFTLAVGGLERRLYASSLTFSSEPPFGTDAAVKFTLTAFSDDPYFYGPEVRFAGVARTQDALAFPASLAFSTGVQRRVGSVTVENPGDAACGFVLEARFVADAPEFILESDREDGMAQLGTTFSAGDTLVIDTRRGSRSVALADGTDLLSDVSRECTFFCAPPGKTKLTWHSFSSASPVVTVRLTPGYVTP